MDKETVCSAADTVPTPCFLFFPSSFRWPARKRLARELLTAACASIPHNRQSFVKQKRPSQEEKSARTASFSCVAAELQRLAVVSIDSRRGNTAEVLIGAHEAGHDVLVGHAMSELPHPESHLGGTCRAQQVALVV